MSKVYLLWHSYELEGSEEDKLIGVYSTRERAEQAVERKLQYPGFRDHPEGFLIANFTIDKDQWSEGFMTE